MGAKFFYNRHHEGCVLQLQKHAKKWNALPGGLHVCPVGLVQCRPSNGIDSQILS